MVQMLNKVLHYTSFPINFCFAVENVWITALMIAFNTPDRVDAFIWIIPNIISILLRPYIITLVHKTRQKEQTQYDLISFFTIVSAIACVLIGTSCYLSNFYAKISICSIGWTLMDLGLDMVEFFQQKLSGKLKKAGYKQDEELRERNQLFGSILGYVASFCVCLLQGGKSFKSFRMCSAYIYFTCATLIMVYWYIINSVHQPSNTEIRQNIKQLSFTTQVGYYLPGFYQLKASKNSHRAQLYIHFAYVYTMDTFYIYATMWAIYLAQSYSYKESYSYNIGMQYGSLLMLFMVFISAITTKILPNSLQEILGKHFQILLLINGFSGWLIYFSPTPLIKIQALIFNAFLTGIVFSIYTNYVEEESKKNNHIFQSCSQLIDRISKIFILCPMPYIVMIVLKRDDIEDCLLWLGVIVCIMVILANSQKLSRHINDRWKGYGRVDKVK